ncbi:putative peroxin [Candida albicans P75010]|nr:putative peroxin [Candida albicans P75010]
MSVPILTIPESSFDPASYNNLNTANITKSKSKSKSQSQILLYIIKLTRRSSLEEKIIWII